MVKRRDVVKRDKGKFLADVMNLKRIAACSAIR